MAAWKKLYVVGDGKKKDAGPPASEPPPPAPPPAPADTGRQPKGRWRRFKNSTAVAVIFFAGGLGLGMVEDDLDDDLLMALNLEEGQELVVNGIPMVNDFFFQDFPIEDTQHSEQRKSERKISEAEIRDVIDHGTIVNFYSKNKEEKVEDEEENKRRSKFNGMPKFNMLGTTNTGRTILVSFVVPRNSDIIKIVTCFAPWERE